MEADHEVAIVNPGGIPPGLRNQLHNRSHESLDRFGPIKPVRSDPPNEYVLPEVELTPFQYRIRTRKFFIVIRPQRILGHTRPLLTLLPE